MTFFSQAGPNHRARSFFFRTILLAIATIACCCSAARAARPQDAKNAGKTLTESSTLYGTIGGMVETTYDSKGRPSGKRERDEKGVVRWERHTSYDLVTGKIVTDGYKEYRADGTLASEYVEWCDAAGKVTMWQMSRFDKDGLFQTSGEIVDLENHTTRMWNRGKLEWEAATPQLLGSSGLQPASWNKFFDECHRLNKSKVSSTTGEPMIAASLGIVAPRAYTPGSTITVSVMPATTAKLFSGIPGLTVRTFDTQLPDEVNAFANLSGLQIGAKNGGISPVINGLCAISIPKTARTPLELQIAQVKLPRDAQYAYSAAAMDPPRLAPEQPSMLTWISEVASHAAELNRLKQAWWKAFDIQEMALEAAQAKNSEVVFAGLMISLLLQDTVDDIAECFPSSEVREVALQMKRQAQAAIGSTALLQTSLVTTSDVEKYQRWIRYLDGQITKFSADNIPLALPGHTRPYWTSPLLVQGKLGALRGPFSGDCHHVRLKIDGMRVEPLAVAPGNFYFMPPPQLASGKHEFEITGDGTPTTRIPFFYMDLKLGAGQIDLLKGQSTQWWSTLQFGEITKSLPTSVWSSSFCPTDLMDVSEITQRVPGFPPPGPGQPGLITVLSTNDTPGVINVSDLPGGFKFQTFTAQTFPQNGTLQENGTVTALVRGPWSISVTARAFLQPIAAYGDSNAAPRQQQAVNVSNDGAGETPTTEVKPTREELEKKLKEAQDRADQAKSKIPRAREKEQKTWNDALKRVPEEYVKRMHEAENSWNKAWREYMNAADADTGSANSKADIDSKKIAYQAATRAEADARQSVIDHMNASDRTVWRSAQQELNDLKLQQVLAEEDVREAQQQLSEIER